MCRKCERHSLSARGRACLSTTLETRINKNKSAGCYGIGVSENVGKHKWFPACTLVGIAAMMSEQLLPGKPPVWKAAKFCALCIVKLCAHLTSHDRRVVSGQWLETWVAGWTGLAGGRATATCCEIPGYRCFFLIVFVSYQKLSRSCYWGLFKAKWMAILALHLFTLWFFIRAGY